MENIKMLSIIGMGAVGAYAFMMVTISDILSGGCVEAANVMASYGFVIALISAVATVKWASEEMI